MNLALEASNRNLVVHTMEGFDYEKAAKLIQLPKDHAIETMLTVGKKASKEFLPDSGMIEREFPKGRKPLSDIVFEGKMH